MVKFIINKCKCISRLKYQEFKFFISFFKNINKPTKKTCNKKFAFERVIPIILKLISLHDGNLLNISSILVGTLHSHKALIIFLSTKLWYREIIIFSIEVIIIIKILICLGEINIKQRPA